MTTPANKHRIEYNEASGIIPPPESSSDDTPIDKTSAHKSWLVRVTKQVLNMDDSLKFVNTKPGYYIPTPSHPLFYQPYGTFMDFGQDVYLNPKYVDLKYNPDSAYPSSNIHNVTNSSNSHIESQSYKTNNLDAYLLKNELKNISLIKSSIANLQ